MEIRAKIVDQLLRSLNPTRKEIDKLWAKEAEKRVEERTPKDVMCGIGGAGTFSDGKLHFSPVLSHEKMLHLFTINEYQKYLDRVDRIFMDFGVDAELYPRDMSKTRDFVDEAKKHNIRLVIRRNKHIGTDKLPAIIRNFQDYLEDKKVNILTNIDWFTIVIYLILVLLGWINIYAAVYNEEHHSIFDLTQRYGKQLLWIIAAFALAFIVMLIESRFYSIFAYFIYAIFLLLLIGVLLFGTEIHGTKSWFTFGNFHFQPSEFAKFATGLALANYLSTYNLKIQIIGVVG